MLARLNKIKNWQAVTIILLVGFITFFRGLKNQFIGDDFPQIVNNLPVHSISNLRQFFEGGTFYAAGVGLNGMYYRPLMTTTFSVLYTLFGPHPFYFHLTQLLLDIGSSVILYLFLRYSFKPLLSLLLALIFLVHPINSEIVYAIPCMQDALYFFFGMLALWILARSQSIKSLILVTVSLFLSLLAKETAILFVILSVLYLFWWNRRRLYSFIIMISLPIVVWFFLRINAIGLNPAPDNAPIDSLDLAHRLLNVPAIMEFYLSKVVFPWRLASEYYWVYSKISIEHFFVPLCVDIAVMTVMILVGIKISRCSTKVLHYTYLFFAAWFIFGMLLIVQIIPLDMTVSEAWFYFPIVGILGMLGVVLTAFYSVNINRKEFIYWLMIILIIIFGVRSALRATDWRGALALDYTNIKTSNDDYVGEENIAAALYNQGKLVEAKPYAEASIKIYTTGDNYYVLGLIDSEQGNYIQAEKVFHAGLQHKDSLEADQLLSENDARMMVLVSKPASAKQFIENGLDSYPQDADLWLYLALVDYKSGDVADAKYAISKAVNYSDNQNSTIAAASSIIMNNGSLKLK